MSSIKDAMQNTLPLYMCEELSSCEKLSSRSALDISHELSLKGQSCAGGSRSSLKSTIVVPDVDVTRMYARPLHTRSIKQTFPSCTPDLKVAILGAFVLVGTAVGGYCAHRYFESNNPIDEDVLSQNVRNGWDLSHRLVHERAMPIASPLENQVVFPGSLFQVNHEFFTESGGGFIQQKITQGPSWLTLQLNPNVSSYEIFGSANGVQVVGHTAYVAYYVLLAGTGGLSIINITLPSNLTFIGTYTTPKSSYEVKVIGNTAYLASADGLRIINVATPSRPTLIGTYKTSGQALGVQIVGTNAYVTDDSGSLRIINIATPSRPTLVGSYSTPGVPQGVQIVGMTAYVGLDSGSLQIINITKSNNPTLIGSYNTLGNACDLHVVGTIAYIADGTGGLSIINITKPSNPKLIGTYKTALDVRGVQVVGTTAFVAAVYGGLMLIDVTVPSYPTLITAYMTPGQPYQVQVVGTTAYVADNFGGLQILSGLNRLTLLGNKSTLERSNYQVVIAGTTAAGTASTSFKLYVGSLLAPIYQNPISTQKATVDKSFNYIMPDNVFVGQNGDAIFYKAKDLPKWLIFDATTRTFSGKPTSGDTDTYADQSTIVTVTAIDGKFETPGQFTVTVTGDSYFGKIVRVVLPSLSALGTLYSGYKNRAWLLNIFGKRRWKNNQIRVIIGENFIYELKTHAKNVRKVQAYVKDERLFSKMKEKFLCGRKSHVALVSSLPTWMEYNSDVNTLFSTKQIEEIDLMGQRNIQIRVLGDGGVIKELLHLTLEGDTPICNGTFDSLARIDQERVRLLLFPSTHAVEMGGLGSADFETLSV